MRGYTYIHTHASDLNKQIQYLLLSFILIVGFVLLRTIPWTGTSAIHTIMETIATVLACMVGIMALARFYARRNTLFLLIGAAFIGTGLLDAYHAVVTSSIFIVYFPSPPVSLIPWSWVASRFFLSVMMFLAWGVCRHEKTSLQMNSVSPRWVYTVVGLLTLVSFLFFSLYPLPRAFYPELFVGRPEEIIPAFFFFMALVGFYIKGDWRSSSFDHWLVMSLIVGFLGQLLFMSSSYQLFDTMFDMAHLLKKLSYIFVLTGLLVSMYRLFIQTEEVQHQLKIKNDSLEQANVALEQTKKVLADKKNEVEEALKMAEFEKQKTMEKMYELEQTSKAMVGRELEMIALKKKVEELSRRKDS
jgi:hypothetical protein